MQKYAQFYSEGSRLFIADLIGAAYAAPEYVVGRATPTPYANSMTGDDLFTPAPVMSQTTPRDTLSGEIEFLAPDVRPLSVTFTFLFDMNRPWYSEENNFWWQGIEKYSRSIGKEASIKVTSDTSSRVIKGFIENISADRFQKDRIIEVTMLCQPYWEGVSSVSHSFASITSGFTVPYEGDSLTPFEMTIKATGNVSEFFLLGYDPLGRSRTLYSESWDAPTVTERKALSYDSILGRIKLGVVNSSGTPVYSSTPIDLTQMSKLDVSHHIGPSDRTSRIGLVITPSGGSADVDITYTPRYTGII